MIRKAPNKIKNLSAGIMKFFTKFLVSTSTALIMMCLLFPLNAEAVSQVERIKDENISTWVYQNEAKIDREGMSEANLEEAMRLLGDYKKGPQKAYLSYLMGLNLLSQGHINAGYALMDQALVELAVKPNHDVEMVVLSRQLEVDGYFQKVTSMAEKGFRLHHIAEAEKDTQKVIMADVALVGAYVYMGDQEKVAEFMSEMDQLIFKNTSNKGLDAIYMLKGDLAIDQHRNEEALAHYALAYEYAAKYKRYGPFIPRTTLIKTRMAEVNIRIGHLAESQALVEEVSAMVNQERPIEMANLYYHKALLSNANGQVQQAISDFERVRAISKDLEVLSGTMSAEHFINRILAELYYQVGAYKKSAEAFQKFENTLESPQAANQWSSAISNVRSHEEEHLKEKVRIAEALRLNQGKFVKAQNDKLIVFRALIVALMVIVFLILLNVQSLKKRQKQLIHLSSTDYLTQVMNRDAMMKVVQKAETDGHILMLMDIDNFKHINDQHGHLVGDEVLVQIAKVIKASLREKDHLARYGGEEFLVFLEDTELQEGAEIADRIRRSVEQIKWQEPNLVTTLSMGVVNTFSKDVDAILKEADVLMYHAKENGKNRICVREDLEAEIKAEDEGDDWIH